MDSSIKIWRVLGQALAPVDVVQFVRARNEDEAKSKAIKKFNKGVHGSITYAKDDSQAHSYVTYSANIDE